MFRVEAVRFAELCAPPSVACGIFFKALFAFSHCCMRNSQRIQPPLCIRRLCEKCFRHRRECGSILSPQMRCIRKDYFGTLPKGWTVIKKAI